MFGAGEVHTGGIVEEEEKLQWHGKEAERSFARCLQRWERDGED
jgi:hypothetical protein